MRLKKRIKISRREVITGVMFLFVVGVLAVFSTFSEEEGIQLKKGKNFVELNITEPFYVSSLVKLNPDIEVVSYKEGNESIGYVNVFGGIGRDFVVDEGVYEIVVKKDIVLVIPGRIK